MICQNAPKEYKIKNTEIPIRVFIFEKKKKRKVLVK
jgi:hypothetical protein